MCHSEVPCRVWRPQMPSCQSHLRATDRRTGHRDQISLPVGDGEHLWFLCPSFIIFKKSYIVYDLTFAKEVVGSWRFTFKVNACLQKPSFPAVFQNDLDRKQPPDRPLGIFFSSKYRTTVEVTQHPTQQLFVKVRIVRSFAILDVAVWKFPHPST